MELWFKKSSGFIKNGLQARPAALFVQEANRFHRYLHRERWEDSKCKEHNGDYELSNWYW